MSLELCETWRNLIEAGAEAASRELSDYGR